MSQNIEKDLDGDKDFTSPDNMESLIEISSKSLDEGITSSLPEQTKLEEIVKSCLAQIESYVHNDEINVNQLVDLILPKVRQELKTLDNLYDDVLSVKSCLKSYLGQMKTVDQDIADIFLDLHEIYRKLEKIDDQSNKLSPSQMEKLSRKVQESEDYQEQNRHYLSNDPKELNAMLNGPPMDTASDGKVREHSFTNSTKSNHRYKGGLNQLGTSYERNFRDVCTEKAQKRLFLTNMLMAKKSDFSLHLNRYKTYYVDVNRALNFKNSSLCSQFKYH